MEAKSKTYGIVGFIFVILGFTGKLFYRDYINSNHIHDFGISDFLPSFFYVIGFSQMLLMVTAKFPKTTILIVTLASVLFEVKQFYSNSLLDIKDIIASLVGGLISIGVWKFIDNKYFKNADSPGR
jgi:glycopeptide antibiotics resistance protein